MRSRLAASAAAVFATQLVLATAHAAPADGDADAAGAGKAISVELNKLEPVKSACRAYLVVKNDTADALSSLRLDLVMFGSDGVIAKRLAVEAAPLPAGKTAVRLFDMDGTPCDGISRVLLNDVLSCRSEAGDRADCLAAIETSSRTAAEFIR